MDTACSIVMGALAGLHYAHGHGVLHRDMKPDNLMFSSEGLVKVTDFGIAKVVGGDETFATKAGSVLGTPAYMAPEQALAGDLSPATDVYATGVMFYELMSGKLPFSEEGSAIAIVYRHVNDDPTPLRSVAPAVPAPLAAATMQALERATDDRFSTAEDFAVAIGEAATESWGAGWLDQAQVPLMAPGRILASTERPTERATGGARPGGTTVTKGGAAPPTAIIGGGGAAAPAPATQLVRPSVAGHVAGADADDVAIADLVPVRDVIAPPPRVQLAVALVLLVVTAVLAVAGLRTPSRSGTLAPGAASVNGVDPTGGRDVTLDFSKPVQVSVAAGGLGAPTTAELKFSQLGIPLGGSGAQPLTGGGGARTASLDVSGSRYLVAGTVTGDLVLRAGDLETGHQQLGVESTQTSALTVPAAIAVVLLLLVVAYGEAVLRPLRRGRRRRSAPVVLAAVGAVLGVVLVLLAWVAGVSEPTAAALGACAATGAGSGIAVAVTARRAGLRRKRRARTG